jgi:WD40 repeat protein
VALKSTRLIFPSYSSRFVAVDPKPAGQKMNGDWFQVYELQSHRAVGPAFPTPVDLGGTRVLSPDGAYIAARAKGQHATISIWDCKTGELARSIEVSADPKRFAFPADFAWPNRLLTRCHDGLFPDWGERTLYQLWDAATGKEIVRFEANLVWSAKWATISPGGRYMVMQHTAIRSYRLWAWDLTTGQPAGEAEFQGKDDPWGQACGVVFSPDCTLLAIPWRLGKPDLWGRVIVFDVIHGRQVASVPVDRTMKNLDMALGVNDRPALQWTPGGDGWLLMGHLLMDSKTGGVLGRIGKEPGASWDLQPRRFIGQNLLTTIVNLNREQQLAFAPLPNKE